MFLIVFKTVLCIRKQSVAEQEYYGEKYEFFNERVGIQNLLIE
jgi:hypothetical protein